jgi:adenosylmethionine-8-amino-7-oxononanoate aminotransferase
VIARGEGINLWDRNGRRYLDASSGPVVSNLGHGNRRVLEAMRVQAEAVTLAYPGLFESDANVALADLVCNLAWPRLDRAFFVFGGSEATEAAIKLARQYALAIGQSSRVTVIGREPSYHGATLGALAVTGDHYAEEIFGPLMRAMPKVPAPLTYRQPPGHTAESRTRRPARRRWRTRSFVARARGRRCARALRPACARSAVPLAGHRGAARGGEAAEEGRETGTALAPAEARHRSLFARRRRARR